MLQKFQAWSWVKGVKDQWDGNMDKEEGAEAREQDKYLVKLEEAREWWKWKSLASRFILVMLATTELGTTGHFWTKRPGTGVARVVQNRTEVYVAELYGEAYAMLA